jgi:hypothetical protein
MFLILTPQILNSVLYTTFLNSILHNSGTLLMSGFVQ